MAYRGLMGVIICYWNIVTHPINRLRVSGSVCRVMLLMYRLVSMAIFGVLINQAYYGDGRTMIGDELKVLTQRRLVLVIVIIFILQHPMVNYIDILVYHPYDAHIRLYIAHILVCLYMYLYELIITGNLRFVRVEGVAHVTSLGVAADGTVAYTNRKHEIFVSYGRDRVAAQATIIAPSTTATTTAAAPTSVASTTTAPSVTASSTSTAAASSVARS